MHDEDSESHELKGALQSIQVPPMAVLENNLSGVEKATLSALIEALEASAGLLQTA